MRRREGSVRVSVAEYAALLALHRAARELRPYTRFDPNGWGRLGYLGSDDVKCGVGDLARAVDALERLGGPCAYEAWPWRGWRLGLIPRFYRLRPWWWRVRYEALGDGCGPWPAVRTLTVGPLEFRWRR
jgi:hypothetical protein